MQVDKHIFDFYLFFFLDIVDFTLLYSLSQKSTHSPSEPYKVCISQEKSPDLKFILLFKAEEVGVQSCQETVSTTPLVREEGCGLSLTERTAAARRRHFCATHFPSLHAH